MAAVSASTSIRSVFTRASAGLFLAAAVAGCASATTPPAAPPPATESAAPLERIAVIHGGAGPWVVAGYRMGTFAIAQLGLKQGSFDLDVVHHSPKEVQYSCVADGAAAATGASLGKLNLSLTEATAADVHTTYRRKSTGQTLTLRPARSFIERYKDVPRPRLAETGREVYALPDAQIFEVVPP